VKKEGVDPNPLLVKKEGTRSEDDDERSNIMALRPVSVLELEEPGYAMAMKRQWRW
jgi:hypothetical protein